MFESSSYSNKMFFDIYFNGDALELIAMRSIVPHVEVSDSNSLNLHKTITDEMSTMTFDSLMEFIGADYAVAA